MASYFAPISTTRYRARRLCTLSYFSVRLTFISPQPAKHCPTQFCYFLLDLIKRLLSMNKRKACPSLISPCQGRHGKYLKNYSRKFHVGVLVSAWDLRHFVMPRILLCISESVCSRQSGTVPGSSRAELLCELPLASLLQIAPENVHNCKNGCIGRWPNAARRRY